MQRAGHMEVRGGQVGQLRARAPAGARARCGRPPGRRQVSLQRPHDGQHVRNLPGRDPDLQACCGSHQAVALLAVLFMGRQGKARPTIYVIRLPKTHKLWHVLRTQYA